MEDFADVSASWVFLEEDTTHFMAMHEAPSCIVRHRSVLGLDETDFVFRARNAAQPRVLELTLLVTAHEDTTLSEDTHRYLLGRFLDDLATYLRRHAAPITVDVYDHARTAYAA
ncbi:MAG: hypothetical protein AAGI71_09875 [Bacteroidota bacterium]